MAGRFCQSCRCEPVTAGPPTCFCFGSLVRKNQNDSPPPRPPSGEQGQVDCFQSRLGTRLGIGWVRRWSWDKRRKPRGQLCQLRAEEGWLQDRLRAARGGRWGGRQPWSRRFCLLRLHTSSLYSFQLVPFCCCTGFTTPLTH